MNIQRLNWTIKQGVVWFATYIDGTVLMSRTKLLLMSEMKTYELSL